MFENALAMRGAHTAIRWRTSMTTLAALLTLAATGVGCAEGEGSIAFRAAGGTFVEMGISSDGDGRGGGAGFRDGWSLSFDRYVVAFADVVAEASDGEAGGASEGVVVAELSAGPQSLLELDGLPARRWDRIGWSTRAPVDGEAVERRGATEAEVERMRAGGFASLVSGTATHPDGRVVTFDWGLQNGARSERCANGIDGTDGLVVRAGGTNEAEITVHAEHMFWDSLGIEALDLRFEAIAAVAGPDGGEVRFEDLAGQRLTDLRDAEGAPLRDEMGFPLLYVGDVDDLGEFILESTRRQLHLNGGGLCGDITPI